MELEVSALVARWVARKGLSMELLGSCWMLSAHPGFADDAYQEVILVLEPRGKVMQARAGCGAFWRVNIAH